MIPILVKMAELARTLDRNINVFVLQDLQEQIAKVTLENRLFSNTKVILITSPCLSPKNNGLAAQMAQRIEWLTLELLTRI